MSLWRTAYSFRSTTHTVQTSFKSSTIPFFQMKTPNNLVYKKSFGTNYIIKMVQPKSNVCLFSGAYMRSRPEWYEKEYEHE